MTEGDVPGERPRPRGSGSRRISRSTMAALEAVALRAETGRRLETGAAQAVLRSIVEATVALFEAEAASIALYDATVDRLTFVVAAGEQGQGVVGLSIPPDQGIAGYAYTSGQSLALSDVERDRRFGRRTAEQTGYLPRSIVAVPLVDEHGTIGVLEVLDKRESAAFSLRDIELAAVFARQAAVAITASRVERDASTLLSTVVRTVLDGAPDAAVDELVAAATASLDRDDESGLWRLVEQVARVRRADPEQLALVTDLLGVLATHAERRARPRGRRRAVPNA